jgi:hypothetical protein
MEMANVCEHYFDFRRHPQKGIGTTSTTLRGVYTVSKAYCCVSYVGLATYVQHR